jgi:putative membrane protein
MDLLLGTVLLRPYVFGFVAAFVAAGVRDLGWRRTLAFGGLVWPLAWLAELSSTHTGFPFGLYHYTGLTRDREVFVAGVPLMDSLSFTFLAYASYCLARVSLRGRAASRSTVALTSGILMMALDVVIDPAAVRGDRWFLGPIFYYPEGGIYFGVPLSNFAGWVLVGTVGVGSFLMVTGPADERPGVSEPRLLGAGAARPARAEGGPFQEPGAPTRPVDRRRPDPGRPVPGVALYYAVLGFNLAVTAWMGEWMLAALGAALHAVVAVTLVRISHQAGAPLGLGDRGIQQA